MRITLATLALLAVLLLTACVNDARPETCDADEVSLALTVAADHMTPNDPAACRDQRVTLVIDAETSGLFHIHGYDQAIPATPIESGEETTVEFVADHSGQFTIELHPEDDPEGVAIGIFTVYEP